MIIVRLSGGLGNQMFQYAAGLSLARRHCVELRFDLEWFRAVQLHQGLELPRVFGIDLPAASRADMWKVLGISALPVLRSGLSRRALRALRPSRLVVEPHFHYWREFERLPSKVYLDGYWQSEQYFASTKELLRTRFSFAMPMDSRSADVAHEMKAVESVSLHVRRGDFAHDPAVRRIHGVDLNNYYRRAIEQIERFVKNPHFYVFSDETEWVRKNLSIRHPCTIVSHNRGKNDFRDMQLMHQCAHHIVANSTFSWWGAWLSGPKEGIVIAPATWFNTSAINSKDLYCNAWLVL